MLIGQVAKRSGLSRHTIRYYLESGLITSTQRPAGQSTYAVFDESVVGQLAAIKAAQSAGFTLREIKDLLHDWQNGKLTREQREAILLGKLAELQQRKQEIINLETILRKRLENPDRC